jgi:FkbM family methyltransferase
MGMAGDWHIALRHLARLTRSTVGLDLRLGPLMRVPSERLGSEYGGWWVRTDLISPSSLVYSAGVGTDITFDVALIERFGCEVFGFDPTPVSVKWVSSHAPPLGFHFIPIGLAGYDGTASFALRSDPTYASYEMNVPTAQAFDVVTCPVRRLATVMKELRHRHLAVLKLDIEGAELEVIPDVISSSIAVDQILVEFHHKRSSRESVRFAQRVVDLLRQAGYRPFALSPNGREISFAR